MPCSSLGLNGILEAKMAESSMVDLRQILQSELYEALT